MALSLLVCESQEKFPFDFYCPRVGLFTDYPLDRDYIHSVYKNINMDGTELRAIRHKLGLSQHQFAEELGIHWNSVARQERGESGISGSVEKLARLLLRVRELEQKKEKTPKKKC